MCDYFFRFINQTNVPIPSLYSLLLTKRIIISMRIVRISIIVNDLTQKYDISIILMS